MAAHKFAKVCKVKQGPDESPAAFLEQLIEAFCQYTCYDSRGKESKATMTMVLIDGASKDIRKKFQWLEGFGAGC